MANYQGINAFSQGLLQGIQTIAQVQDLRARQRERVETQKWQEWKQKSAEINDTIKTAKTLAPFRRGAYIKQRLGGLGKNDSTLQGLGDFIANAQAEDLDQIGKIVANVNKKVEAGQPIDNDLYELEARYGSEIPENVLKNLYERAGVKRETKNKVNEAKLLGNIKNILAKDLTRFKTKASLESGKELAAFKSKLPAKPKAEQPYTLNDINKRIDKLETEKAKLQKGGGLSIIEQILLKDDPEAMKQKQLEVEPTLKPAIEEKERQLVILRAERDKMEGKQQTGIPTTENPEEQIKRQQAIDLLKQNNKQVTEATIEDIMRQLGNP